MTETMTDGADTVNQAAHPPAAVATASRDASSTEDVLEDQLVEDVSIDGMCGVY